MDFWVGQGGWETDLVEVGRREAGMMQIWDTRTAFRNDWQRSSEPKLELQRSKQAESKTQSCKAEV